jgi:hypothetical protein
MLARSGSVPKVVILQFVNGQAGGIHHIAFTSENMTDDIMLSLLTTCVLYSNLSVVLC